MTLKITISHDEPKSAFALVVVDTYNHQRIEIAPGKKSEILMHSMKSLVVLEVPKHQIQS